MGRKKKGVISFFSAIAIGVTLSLIFALLDGARVVSLRSLMEPRTKLLTDNVMSNYQKELYEQFGILGLDQEYSEVDRRKEFVAKELLEEEFLYEKTIEKDGVGIDFLRYQSMEVMDSKYQLLTDGDGGVYLNQVARYMTSFLPKEMLDKTMETFESQSTFQRENKISDILADAKAALSEASAMIETEEDEEPVELGCGEIAAYEAKKSSPILELLLPKEEISNKRILEQYCPSKRDLQTGTCDIEETGELQKFLGVLYSREKFPSFVSRSEDEYISYQLEYLVAGRMSDAENLKIVCEKLLLLREAVQFAMMLIDPVQCEKAEAMALALVGFTGNPLIIKAVQLGILAAWSLDEAIKDVKFLLDGKKISISEKGNDICWGYEDYLSFLLLFNSREEIAMRGLDMVEHKVNACIEIGDFQSDQVITKIEGRIRGRISWIFGRVLLVPISSLQTITKEISFRGCYE